MAQVFISYSRADKEPVVLFMEWLKEYSISFWYDEKTEYGERWWDMIQNQIEASRYFLIFMSPASRESSWVKRELAIANSCRTTVIPILLRGEIFEALKEIEILDISSGRLPPIRFFYFLLGSVLKSQILLNPIKNCSKQDEVFERLFAAFVSS